MEAENSNQPISVGQWMLNMLILYIPVVNIVMLIVWAASSDTPQTKKNWAIARLVWMAIGTVLLFLFYGALAALFLTQGGFDNF